MQQQNLGETPANGILNVINSVTHSNNVYLLLCLEKQVMQNIPKRIKSSQIYITAYTGGDNIYLFIVIFVYSACSVSNLNGHQTFVVSFSNFCFSNYTTQKILLYMYDIYSLNLTRTTK